MGEIQRGQIMLEEIEKKLRKDGYAALLGVELLSVGEGTARVRMTVEDRHRNFLGYVHGGAIFSLADQAFAAASNSHNRQSLAINMAVSFLAAARGPVLYAEAVEESLNPKLATYTMRVTEENGTLVALIQGTVYRKGEAVV